MFYQRIKVSNIYLQSKIINKKIQLQVKLYIFLLVSVNILFSVVSVLLVGLYSKNNSLMSLFLAKII